MVSPFVLLKTGVFTVLVPGTVAGLIPRLLARYDREAPLLDSRIARVIGRVSLISGFLLYLHTALQFSFEGRGTPSPSHETEELVTGGIYAYMRNPIVRRRTLTHRWTSCPVLIIPCSLVGRCMLARLPSTYHRV